MASTEVCCKSANCFSRSASLSKNSRSSRLISASILARCRSRWPFGCTSAALCSAAPTLGVLPNALSPKVCVCGAGGCSEGSRSLLTSLWSCTTPASSILMASINFVAVSPIVLRTPLAARLMLSAICLAAPESFCFLPISLTSLAASVAAVFNGFTASGAVTFMPAAIFSEIWRTFSVSARGYSRSAASTLPLLSSRARCLLAAEALSSTSAARFNSPRVMPSASRRAHAEPSLASPTAWRIARPADCAFLSVSGDLAPIASPAASTASAAVRMRETTIFVKSRWLAISFRFLLTSTCTPATLAPLACLSFSTASLSVISRSFL